jgi:hypothetical protein
VPSWWYDRRSTRNVAAGATAVGVLALVTSSATGTGFAATVGLVAFVVAATTAARARSWQLFAVAVVLLAYVVLFGLLVVLFSGGDWAPF